MERREITLPGCSFLFFQPVPVQWEGPCFSSLLVPPCRVVKMCKGQRVVAALSLLGCGQLLPDVFNLPPEPQWMWMDIAPFSPVSTTALCPRAGDEAWQRQGNI